MREADRGLMGEDAAQPSSAPGPLAAKRPSNKPLFAHASEAELGRILDFYQVRWQYEPHVFPILWNLDGAVVESFSPDFYLPDFDTYLELTTLRQPLVRKKNRKLRRLRELYPDIRIKLFYARDFRALMLKYGQLGLVGALSGTLGQVGPVVPLHDPADDLDGLVTDVPARIPAAARHAVEPTGEAVEPVQPRARRGRRRRRALASEPLAPGSDA